jgi:hypothetical protein
MQAIHYELKYCERCGALRLRRADSVESYCSCCEDVLFREALPHGALQSKLLRRKARAATATMPALRAEGQLELACGVLP